MNHVTDALGINVPNAPVPQVSGAIIVDADAAIRLGKALFWDTQTGSDGQIACASCHFHAGADNRTRNTVHPGGTSFEIVSGAGQALSLTSFDATLVNDRVGSSGVLSKSFTGIAADVNDAVDVCADVTPGDASQAVLFSAGERLVTGRNTPPALGAVFNNDNFWDGRAKNGFNGFSPIGANDADHPTALMTNSSLASQSVGPPLSDVEMSCAGRKWNGPNSLGAKLVVRYPLAKQVVHPNDGVLGALSKFPDPGIDCGFPDRPCTYADLIAAAFGTNGLSGQAAIDSYIDSFSTIWGQAIQAYESTLIPDQTPYDKFMRGNATALTAAQQHGLSLFRAKCAVCHTEPELSDASVRLAGVTNPDGADPGFHNIGVSPESEDLGRGNSPGPHGTQAANNGAFKTPALRNAKLTAPYMHNGRFATLADVVDFYDNDATPLNVILTNPNISPIMPQGVGGGAQNRADVVDFLANGLTDCRVEHELAPFDHPALALPNSAADLPPRGAAGDGTFCP